VDRGDVSVKDIASRLLGVTSSAGGSQDWEHLPGYPLHVRNPPAAADDEGWWQRAALRGNNPHQ